MKTLELEPYAGREDFRVDELLEIANRLVEIIAPVQPSDRVAETLSERTLRYYISEGLVDRPSGKEGAAALYSFRHLLQLLALKRLQASYFPVKRIKEIVPDSSNDELRTIIEGAGAQPELSIRDNAMSYLSSLTLEEQAWNRVESRMLPAGQRQMFGPQAPPDAAGGVALPAPPQSWERLVLDDGIELHIRADRRESLRKGELRRMLERTLKSLGNLA
jgi:DNA-binding transcriptional MerR regulator